MKNGKNHKKVLQSILWDILKNFRKKLFLSFDERKMEKFLI